MTLEIISTQSGRTVWFVMELEDVTTQQPPFLMSRSRTPSAISTAAKKFSAMIISAGRTGPTPALQMMPVEALGKFLVNGLQCSLAAFLL